MLNVDCIETWQILVVISLYLDERVYTHTVVVVVTLVVLNIIFITEYHTKGRLH